MTFVALAAARRDHNTVNNADTNVTCFRQRCQVNHDRP